MAATSNCFCSNLREIIFGDLKSLVRHEMYIASVSLIQQLESIFEQRIQVFETCSTKLNRSSSMFNTNNGFNIDNDKNITQPSSISVKAEVNENLATVSDHLTATDNSSSINNSPENIAVYFADDINDNELQDFEADEHVSTFDCNIDSLDDEINVEEESNATSNALDNLDDENIEDNGATALTMINDANNGDGFLPVLLSDGKRRYRCLFCGQIKRSPVDARRHVMVHTRERPHTCELCGKAFSRRHSVYHHLKRCHNINFTVERRGPYSRMVLQNDI